MAEKTHILFVLAAALLLASCVEAPPRPDAFTATGEIIALSGGDAGARYACVACHGVNGRGNGLDAPALAGLPAGYLQKQLEDYAARRGVDLATAERWLRPNLD